MNRPLLAALTAMILVTSASAEVPRTISYQGILTDISGTPLPDGDYSLTVRLYDAASGGSLLYTENHPSVAISNGGFNVMLGSLTPLNLSFDVPLWLSLQVGADPELAPRVALGSSPYALGLALPFDGTADGPAAAFKVHNSDGPAISADGDVSIYTGGGASPIVTVQPFSTQGGQIAAKDEAGNNIVRVEPDGNGTGGFLSVYRSASVLGFTVNGNDGTEEPIVSVLGSARSAVLDMSMAGDPAVALPSSCISSLEEWNEPGVAQLFSNSSLAIGTGITTITSRTITVPEDGYVLAIASGSIELGHVNGADSRIIYGINDANGVFASSSAVTGVPSAAPSGNYRMATPWVGVWPETAGAHTFYLLAQRVGAANGAVLNDPTITLLYVGTAYGTVTGNFTSEGESRPTASGPPTESDLEMEREESIAFDRDRTQRELDLLRQRLDALQERLANDPNAATAAAK